MFRDDACIPACASKVEPGLQAAAGDVGHFQNAGFAEGHACRQGGVFLHRPAGRLRKCSCHRMQRAALDAGGQLQCVGGRQAGGGVGHGQCGGAGAERAGLVEQHHAALRQALQCVTAVDDDAAPRQSAQRGQQGGRSRQGQCARAGDDQHGGGNPRCPRRIDEPPADTGCQGDQQHRHEEGAGIAVGRAQHRRAAGGGPLDQPVQLGQPRIGGAVRHFDDERIAQVQAARHHRHARPAWLWFGFPRQQRLVHLALAFKNQAIHGKGGAGRHRDVVAGLQAPARDALDAAVGAQAVGCFGQPGQTVAQAGGGLLAGTGFEPAGHQQQADDHRHRIEIDLVPLIKGHDAGDDRDGDAQRHRRVHADAPLPGVTPGGREERPGRKQQCRNGEHGLGPDQQLLQVGRNLVTPQIAGNGEHHHLHHAQDAHQHPPQRPAAGARIGALHHVQGQGARLVADVGQPLQQRTGSMVGRLPLQPGTARDHIDLDAGVFVVDGGGQRLGAGGAVHGIDGQDGFLPVRPAGHGAGVLEEFFGIVEDGEGSHHCGE